MKAGGNQLERGAIVGLTDCITSGNRVKELTGPVSQTVYCRGSQCLVVCLVWDAVSASLRFLQLFGVYSGVVWAGWLYPWEFSLPVFVWSWV